MWTDYQSLATIVYWDWFALTFAATEVALDRAMVFVALNSVNWKFLLESIWLNNVARILNQMWNCKTFSLVFWTLTWVVIIEITLVWLISVLNKVSLVEHTSADMYVTLQWLGTGHFEFWRNKTKFKLTVWMTVQVLVALILSTSISCASNIELGSPSLYIIEIANVDLGMLLGGNFRSI